MVVLFSGLAMASEQSKELDRLYDLMKDGFEGVHSRLDALNGRTRINSQDIARQDERLKSMENANKSDPAARWGAGIGGALAVIGAAWQWFKG